MPKSKFFNVARICSIENSKTNTDKTRSLVQLLNSKVEYTYCIQNHSVDTNKVTQNMILMSIQTVLMLSFVLNNYEHSYKTSDMITNLKFILKRFAV